MTPTTTAPSTCVDPTCSPAFPCEPCTWEALVADGDTASQDFFTRSLSHRSTSESTPTRLDGSGCGHARSSGEAPSIRWAKVGDAWVLRGPAEIVVPGATVTVVKADGTTQDKVVGEIVKTRAGEAFAKVAAPTASTGSTRWAKRDGEWVLRTDLTDAAPGLTVTVTKASGESKPAVLGTLIATEGIDSYWTVGRTEPAPSLDLEPHRLYVTADDTVVKVCESKAGRLYGKVLDLDGREFTYNAGALRAIVRAMTQEEASALGHRLHWCCNCGRDLDNLQIGGAHV